MWSGQMEFGIARAELIAIAHPDFCDEFKEATSRLFD